MNTPILSSTFFLTMLMLIGLWFFIRASIKDRTQQLKIVTTAPENSVVAHLKEYFTKRAYRVSKLDAEQNQVTFSGFVRPSWFLAIFLSLLALCGLLCLALVLSLLYPNIGLGFLTLTLLAPLTGVFYWKKAGRTEQVLLELEAPPQSDQEQLYICVTAHRDELNQLKQSFPFEFSTLD